VNWQSNVESGVVAYDVYWSSAQAGAFKLVPGASAAPKGDNQSYSVTFKNPSPARGGTVWIKIRAVKANGTYEESPVMKAIVGGRPLSTPSTSS
jgi:hypothetical protein